MNAGPIINANSANKDKKCCQTTVLIAEDSAFQLIPIQMHFNLRGIKYDVATDGQECLEKFETNFTKTCCDVRYKMVLTDINMPRMNGYKAA